MLLPLTEDGLPLAADRDGIRWLHAFSDETAFAAWALARGEGGREWSYQRVYGARLLDVAVPAVGVPCGVVVDAGSGPEAMLFPPVGGIVPESAAVDTGARERRSATPVAGSAGR
ncbi:SseB family protein [Streptomyces physcomitrii]|uniref:SseB family protein n=1 Tax=Streptomyces physcomitrii TaxID=2724184 RepID=UPI003445FB95